MPAVTASYTARGAPPSAPASAEGPAPATPVPAGPSAPLAHGPHPVAPSLPADATDTGRSRLRAALGTLGRRTALAAAPVVVLAALWELLKTLTSTEDARLPHTWQVLSYFVGEGSTGEGELRLLLTNLATTIQEAFVGLAIGLVAGGALGILTARYATFGRSVRPLLVLTQTLPVVAIAPALVIWLGHSWVSKAVLAALCSFFPVAVSVARGIEDIPAEARSVFASFGASRWQVFRSLEMPNALTQANAAVHTAAALAVVGAVVAELPAGSTEGMAVLVLSSAQFYNFEPAALWCAAITTAVGGLVTVYLAQAIFTRLARLGLRTSSLPTGDH
ncbi:ABC transporter permease [Frankia sp. EI5c]|uniref:ABC transporter permease n=1 Tax=Frankia sp. EI5c TaxID=683316 RepID=UPI000826100A|nr:ABC transporter permease subunit [Frankia sp. EI5c]